MSLCCLGGCFWVTTRHDGDQLRRDVDALDARINTKARVLDGQLGQLQSLLAAATRIVRRNDADLGADVDELRADVRNVDGLAVTTQRSLADLTASIAAYERTNETRMTSLDQRIAQIETGKPRPGAAPDELWRFGNAALAEQRYGDAAEIFTRFATSAPTEPRAAEALYLADQAYSDAGDWDHAIAASEALAQRFPRSDVADDGLYLAAEAAENLKNCSDARAYLGLIRQHYPSSNVAAQARRLDAVIRRALRDKSKCKA